MSNVLDHTKQQQVLALGRLGWTLSRIQETTGIRRETVSGYLKAAGIPVRGRGRPTESTAKPAISGGEVSTDSGPPKPAISEQLSTDLGGAKPATKAEVSTDLAAVPRPGRAPRASACEPYRELIECALERGRNAMAIWQDLVDAHGFSARYASVRRFVQTLRRTAPEPHAVITTAPGEESQVDYGDGPMVRHPVSGKYRRTRLFVLTLGYSRKSIRLLVWQSSAQVWAELHERAFRRLGGSTRVVVLDNLKEGVLTPDIYDPALNPLDCDVLAHYAVVALPCRVGDPDRKGKVESGIGHTQKTPLQGMRFETIDEAQAYLDRWDTRWADTRIHARPNARSPRCLPRSSPRCRRCRSSRFAITASASARCTSMAASRLTRPTTARRQGGSVGVSPCNGMISTSASSIRRRVSYSGSTCALHAGGIASTTPTVRRARRQKRWPS
jgi:transposase